MLLSYLTEQTCGEACWHAREDICRCSCGGKNHGVLRSKDGERPTRTAKIDGIRYELRAVGDRRELYSDAQLLNKYLDDGVTKRYRRIEKPITCQDGKQMQYKYTWRETDPGAPARLKYPSKDQIKRWPELSSLRDKPFYEIRDVAILWVRIDMPDQPTEPLIDQEPEPQYLPVDTGEALPQLTFAPSDNQQLRLF